jgi:alpha-beta hydrolase superfamily lysophospholipase
VQVTAAHVSEAFYARAASADKQLRVYDGVWHTMLSEPQWCDTIYPDILQWVEQRL